MTEQIVILLLVLFAMGAVTLLYHRRRRGAATSRQVVLDSDECTTDNGGLAEKTSYEAIAERSAGPSAAIHEVEGEVDVKRTASSEEPLASPVSPDQVSAAVDNRQHEDRLATIDPEVASPPSREGYEEIDSSEGAQELEDGSQQASANAVPQFGEGTNRAPGAEAEEQETEDTEALVVLSEDSASAAVAGEAKGHSRIHEADELTPSISEFPPGREKTLKKEKQQPQKYQGLARATPQPEESERQAPRSDGGEPTTRDRSLPIEIRLRFEHGGFCRVSLIAKRASGLPEEMTVGAPAGGVDLRAMQDGWYQDVVPDDISSVLKDGTVWTRDGLDGKCSWSLSGRALYVLADRTDISGFVSQACLDLGREHAVLCSEAIRKRVEEAIKITGAEPTAVLDKAMGAPPGWIVFRGVVPTTPVDPVGAADIFNALRPLPRIEISLERGVRLEYANWLEGYPPSIRVYGDPQHTAEVRIDGQIAACGEDGGYQAPGWNSIGSHTVWCSGISKSYSVVPYVASSEPWDAYAFPVSNSSERSITICGPMVRCVSEVLQSQFFSISVPDTNPMLLGRVPGQHALAESVSDVRGAPLIASPPFCPVWALPRDPLHCHKEAVRILLIGDMVLPGVAHENLRATCARGGRCIDEWCRLILDANRKGMKTQPDTEPVRGLWLQYRWLARRIWRERK